MKLGVEIYILKDGKFLENFKFINSIYSILSFNSLSLNNLYNYFINYDNLDDYIEIVNSYDYNDCEILLSDYHFSQYIKGNSLQKNLSEKYKNNQLSKITKEDIIEVLSYFKNIINMVKSKIQFINESELYNHYTFNIKFLYKDIEIEFDYSTILYYYNEDKFRVVIGSEERQFIPINMGRDYIINISINETIRENEVPDVKIEFVK